MGEFDGAFRKDTKSYVTIVVVLLSSRRLVQPGLFSPFFSCKISEPSTDNMFATQPSSQTFLLLDDGRIPNNALLPLVVYTALFQEAHDEETMARAFEKTFKTNNWGDGWRDGVYDFLHYHSTAHEALGVFSGSAKVQFGGEGGIELTIKAGDMVVIPAGVGHQNLGSTSDFKVVGAYPQGQKVDMCYGAASERPRADENIKNLPLPTTDPLYGASGILIREWVHRKTTEE